MIYSSLESEDLHKNNNNNTNNEEGNLDQLIVDIAVETLLQLYYISTKNFMLLLFFFRVYTKDYAYRDESIVYLNSGWTSPWPSNITLVLQIYQREIG